MVLVQVLKLVESEMQVGLVDANGIEELAVIAVDELDFELFNGVTVRVAVICCLAEIFLEGCERVAGPRTSARTDSAPFSHSRNGFAGSQ